MKVKTSVSLSREVLREIDRRGGASNRSGYIEEAVWERIRAEHRRAIGERDKAIYSRLLADPAFESDVLDYSVDPTEDGDEADVPPGEGRERATG